MCFADCLTVHSIVVDSALGVVLTRYWTVLGGLPMSKSIRSKIVQCLMVAYLKQDGLVSSPLSGSQKVYDHELLRYYLVNIVSGLMTWIIAFKMS